MKKRLLLLVTMVTLMLAMAVAPAFAQTMTSSSGFNDLSGVTFGGNCAVNDVVEICDVLPE
jgi:hypothetical protein